MTLIPEWMSNVHPLIVHFPIALLVIAVLADFLGLILKRFQWLRPAALWLYVIGVLGTVAAYISGKEAAEVVHFPAPAYAVVSTHADLALYTMLFFGVYALVRLLAAWKHWDQKTNVALVLFLIAAGGTGLIQQTAERGGELVFRYGVGTKTRPEPARAAAKDTSDVTTVTVAEDGSWRWSAGNKAVLNFKKNFNLIQGDWAKLLLQTVSDNGQNTALRIETESEKPVVFTFGPRLENTQITAKINLNGLKGRFLLIHHFTSPQRYGFLAFENGTIRLGRTIDGKTILGDTDTITQTGWLTVKVVSSGGHYRGYVNDQLLVHGHGTRLPAGANGFALLGSGALQIASIETVNLDNPTDGTMGASSNHSGMSNQH